MSGCVASFLVQKLPLGLHKFGCQHLVSSYKKLGVSANSFHLKPVTTEEVAKAIDITGIFKTTDLDHLPARFITDRVKNVALLWHI